jgi:hypothetical protein
MPLNFERVRQHLNQFAFGPLFIEELGWSLPPGKAVFRIEIEGASYEIKAVAQLGGVPVLEIRSPDGAIPDADRKRVVHCEVSKLHHENLLIFVDAERARSDWYWVRREEGRELPRSHEYLRGQPGDAFLSKIAPLLFEISDFDENGDVKVLEVAQRLKLGLDVEKVTKKFYAEFERQHLQFLGLITGIDDERQRRWYASVLMNRLMFIWFLQRKGFIDAGDLDYLQHKLDASKGRGKDLFFREFLKLLFFEGFAKPVEERSGEARQRLGEIRYLNGGLFLPHAIEQNNPELDVPDRAFENLFALFRSYSWNLNDSPGGNADEINPDVLGYIFEKYINQKAFGAYYTRPEITSYLCERTIERLLLDAVNTPEEVRRANLPGTNYDFRSLSDLLLNLDGLLTRKLLRDVLPKLSILDPACGSGAFLVAAMKTLIKVYTAAFSYARYFDRGDLRLEVQRIEREHPNVEYYVKKSIITNNLYGVDIMEEAVEIARLRLFLALVASAHEIDDLEPLPNIDFNLLPGNSLIGLMRVDEKKFDIGHLFRKSYRQVVDEKNREVEIYRRTATYHDDLRALRDRIDTLRADAGEYLDRILLEEFGALGVKYEEASWDHARQREGKGKKRPLTRDDIRALQPFHWGYEFDEIVNRRGGFDAILTNPPWESVEPSAKEFFADHSNLVSKNKMDIKDFEAELKRLLADPQIMRAWIEYLSRYNHQRSYFRAAPEYENQIPIINGKRHGKDVNLYKLFVERCMRLLRDAGECGIVIPGGIYSDLGAKRLREMLFASTEITGLFGFENRRQVFEGVDSRFKFVVLTFRKGGSTTEFPAAFMRHDVSDLTRFPSEGALPIDVEFVRRVSPDSLSISEFRSTRDVGVAEKMIQFPFLGQEVSAPWKVELHREFNMTDDAHLFHKERGSGMLPLYEGKMIHQFDAFFSEPRYFLLEADARAALVRGGSPDAGLEYERYRLAYRDVARNTDERTMIAAVLPKRVFAGHTLHLSSNLSSREVLYLVAVANSLTFDWLLRYKVSAHCSIFYVNQMPVPRLRDGDTQFDRLVVLAAKLVCTRPEFHDLAREARIKPADAAHDAADRARIRAEIDAIVAHLYAISDDELQHILAAFPLVDPASRVQVLDAFRKWQPPSDDPLLKLIASGESARVEFKSSARWDYKQSTVNKELEKVIVKTVAAFLNSEGGTLLLGVADDGTLLGLEPDYRTLGSKQNADAYENWLMTRLLESLGRDRSRSIRVSFHTVEGKQICRVDVSPSSHPVFFADEKGTERLYVRTGNSTRELAASEMLRYCGEHFERLRASGIQDAAPAAPNSIVTPAVEIANEPDDDAAVASVSESTPKRRLVDEWEIEELLAMVREVVCGPEPIARDQAIHEIAGRMGAERVGSRVREAVESALNTASRRSIIYTDTRGLRPHCRTIGDYSRDDLKNVLRAVVGRTWTDEEEAIRMGARYLGFRRTGSLIQKAFKSALRGALMQGQLERDRQYLRAT